jgi:cellulase/cellobiase CelA1
MARSAPARIRGGLLVAAAALGVVALTPALAAELGTTADDLAAFDLPDARCDAEVSVEPGRTPGNTDPLTYDLLTFTQVAGSCAGLTAEATVRADDAGALAAGTAVAASPTFEVELDAVIWAVDYDGVSLAIGGWGIPTVPVGGGVSTDVDIYTDWGDGYCADVIVSTTSPDPIPWQVDLDLSTFPLNGTPDNVWEADTSFDPPILSAVGLESNDTVSVNSPVEWGFCALRDTPPPPGDVEVEVDIYTDWGAGYCADVFVTTDSVIPITWEVVLVLDTPPVNGTPSSAWNVTWSFDAPELTASGVGWNDTVVDGQVRAWGYCATR